MKTELGVPWRSAGKNRWAQQAQLRPTAHPAWWVGALIVLFLLRCALVAGSGASLHVDEAQYWDWSRNLQWGYYSKPPAVAALIAASEGMFGDSELGLRMLAMLCYPLTALVLAALARDIEALQAPGERGGAGRWTAALFMTSPLAGLLGLVATTDALLLLCWALCLWALWWGLVARRGAAFLVLAGALGLGLLDKYTMAAMLPGIALATWRLGDPQGRLLAAAGVAGSLLIFLPNLVWNAQAGWPTLNHTADITLRSAGPGAGPNWAAAAGFAAAQAVLLAPFLLPALLWGYRSRPLRATQPVPARQALELLACTSLPLLMVGLLQALHGRSELNWIAPVHLALAVALGLLLGRRTAGRAVAAKLAAGWAVAGLLAQAALVTALASGPGFFRLMLSGQEQPASLDAWARMRGWAPAYAQLAETLPPEAGVTVIGSTRAALAHAGYHWRGRGVQRAAWLAGSVPAHHYELTCPWRPGDHAGPLLVLSEGAPPAALSQAVGGLQLLARAELRRSPKGVQELQLHRALSPPPLEPGVKPLRCL